MTLNKSGIRVAESASLILCTLNLDAAAWASTTNSIAGYLKVPLLLSFGFYFVIALLIASQFNLLARLLDPTQPTGEDFDGLRAKDLKRLLEWSPLLHKVIGVLGLLLLIVTIVAEGSVTWTTGSPFEQHHAIDIALCVSALYAIASPVLGAFARLPSAPDELVKAFEQNNT